MYRLDGDEILRVPALEAFSWLEHGFGTKDSGDWLAAEDRATLSQIHSSRVSVAEAPGILGEGDALITRAPGLWVAIKTADCLPVLLVDPEHRAVAVVHAGWRGTAANIVSSTIDTMVSEFHTDPAGVWAAMGPGIRKGCYEVSGDVARQFAEWLPEHEGSGNGTLLDLVEANRRQLAQAGVQAQNVWGEAEAWCTHCEADKLHSFRRDKERAGRMLSAIRIKI